MNEVERVRAALRGVAEDHPPLTVWYAEADEVARLVKDRLR